MGCWRWWGTAVQSLVDELLQIFDLVLGSCGLELEGVVLQVFAVLLEAWELLDQVVQGGVI